MYIKNLLGIFTLSCSLQLSAFETDWIELTKGSADKTTGTTVREINTSEKEGNTTVTVAIPKTAVKSVMMEEVVVYGKNPEKNTTEPVTDVSYQWLIDYEQDYYGLLIRFGKKPVYPVRLYLKSIETNKINP